MESNRLLKAMAVTGSGDQYSSLTERRQADFGDNPIFTENIVDRFKQSKGFLYNNKSDIGRFVLMLITAFPFVALVVTALNSLKAGTGISGINLDDVWALYSVIMIGLFAALSVGGALYWANAYIFFSADDAKTQRKAFIYNNILREYFIDLIRIDGLNEKSNNHLGGLVRIGDPLTVINFNTITKVDNEYDEGWAYSRMILLSGQVKVDNVYKRVTLTLLFNKDFSSLTLQKYSIKQ